MSAYHFELCLRKGFTSMATVLQQDKCVKDNIKMSQTCSNDVWCYLCTNWGVCVSGEEPKYCRKCVLEGDLYCGNCNYYLYPTCHEEGAFNSCEKCAGIIECLDEHYRGGTIVYECTICDRTKCKLCANEDGEDWHYMDGALICSGH